MENNDLVGQIMANMDVPKVQKERKDTKGGKKSKSKNNGDQPVDTPASTAVNPTIGVPPNTKADVPCANKADKEPSQFEQFATLLMNMQKAQFQQLGDLFSSHIGHNQRDESTRANEECRERREQSTSSGVAQSKDILSVLSELNEDSEDEMDGGGEEEEIEGEGLDQLEALFKVGESTSEPVTEKIAKIVDNAMLGGIEKEAMKDILEKYLRPENINEMKVPDVNPEIWKLAMPSTKKRDIELRRTQQMTLKAVTTSVMAMDHIKGKKTKEIDIKWLFNIISHNLIILAGVFSDLNEKRKSNIKPCMGNSPFMDLCKPEARKSNKYLFGEDLSEKVKQITETDKIFKQMSRGNTKNYQTRVPYSQNFGGARKNERGRFHHPYRKQRGFGRGNRWNPRAREQVVSHSQQRTMTEIPSKQTNN